MNKDIEPKEERNATTAVNQETLALRKKNKKRLLPGMFYVRWEIELVSAFVAIVVLMLLPDWLNDKVNLFLSGYNTTMDTNWITVACNILLTLFALYIIFRIGWLFFIRKGDDVTQGKIRLSLATDHVAEIIFSICMIILVIILLISMIEFLAILLKNNLPAKMQNSNGMGQ